jgi:hypothetical protein
MTLFTDLTDRELIDLVYINVAGQKIREKINDFSNIKNWMHVVDEMPYPVGLVYCIGNLNQQIMNGGLIQYFDNNYGIFAFKTLQFLKTISANLSYNILRQSLNVINPQNFEGENFVKIIIEKNYDFLKVAEQLDKLDNQYYKISDRENLEKLVAFYLREHLEEIK